MLAAKRRTYVGLVIIIVLGFLGFSFVWPQYINRGIDFIKPKISDFPILKWLPRFPERDFKLGLDLQGGSRLVYEADISNIAEGEGSEAMAGLRDVIERRVNLFGVGEPMVATQEVRGTQRLIVELPGIKDVQEAIEMLGKTPYLEFKEERKETERDEILEKQKELQKILETDFLNAPQPVIEAKMAEYQDYLVDPYFKPTELTGRYLKKAILSFNQTTMVPEVLLEFNDEGTEIFKDLTSKNVGKRLAIYIDNVLLSAPVVREVIPGGKAQITGDFTVAEAKELVRNLNAGALPVPIKLISQTTIGPSLGFISLQKSLRAALLGFLGICLFILVFYRLSGFLAALALLIYGGIMLTLFKLIPVTLTLAGIGGAILSVGMAVDANVLIFERQKEERKKGDSFQGAVQKGFSRAWPSIKDSNLTTLLVALIMFSFGTSFVKGFALTLSLGVLTSMFSAIFVTRTFLKLFIGTRLEKVKWLWK